MKIRKKWENKSMKMKIMEWVLNTKKGNMKMRMIKWKECMSKIKGIIWKVRMTMKVKQKNKNQNKGNGLGLNR